MIGLTTGVVDRLNHIRGKEERREEERTGSRRSSARQCRGPSRSNA